MAKKILIVEDDEVLADAYRLKLSEDAGYNALVVNNAKEAQAKITSFAPDLIILDILMPDVDGFELLKIWQESGVTNNIPITVATNLTNVESVNKALALGAKSYFIKSEVLPDDLVKHCQKMLEPNTKNNSSI